MNETNGIRPFLCEAIDKSLIRSEWEKWLRAFTFYIQAEEISDAVKKKNKLLHYGGIQLQEVAYNIPGALTSGEKDDAFKMLVDKLTDYFSPERNSTFERHLFRSLKAEAGETFNKFLLRTRQQASRCVFGETKTDILEISIKYKLIDSWASADLKKRLMEKEHSLKEIIEICQVHEQINAQWKAMDAPGTSVEINKIADTSECFRCGQYSHDGNSSDCPARKIKCNKCGLVGHCARKCRTVSNKRKFSSVDNRNPKRRDFGYSKIIYINGQSKPNDDCCFKIFGKGESAIEVIPCFVGGKKISMLIDSGSKYNLLCEDDWHLLKTEKAVMWNTRFKSEHQFKTYAGNVPLTIKAVFEAIIGLEESSNLISTFYVIERGEHCWVKILPSNWGY